MSSALSQLSDKQLEQFDQEDLAKIASGKYKSDDDLLNDLSPNALAVIAGSDSTPGKMKEDLDEANKMSRTEAAKIGVEQGVSFGLRPAIKGAAGGLGAFIGQMEQSKQGEGLADKLKRSFQAIPAAYDEERLAGLEEQSRAAKDRPGYNIAGNIGGAVLTAPLIAAKGLAGAMTLGGAQQAGEAVSEEVGLVEGLKRTGKGAAIGGLTFGAIKGAEKAAPSIKEALSKAASKTGEKISKAATKIGSALTGVPEQDIKTYAKYADEISAMAKSSDGNISEAADQIRQKFADQISKTRSNLNGQISEALKASDKAVEVRPILEALSSQKTKINPKLYPKEIGQIDDLIEKVGSLSTEGKLPVSSAHEIKAFLQDRASSAYGLPGDPASLGTEAAKAAKSGAAIARKLVNEAEPAVANANNQLSKLHEIMDGMNRNVFTPGKPEAALLAAGSGGNTRNANALMDLGAATGSDMIGEAQKLSAMRSFNNPQILPVDTTGKAVARMATGAGAGTLIGGPAGTVIGGALTSPAALKLAIDTGRISKSALESMLGRSIAMTEQGLNDLSKFLATPQGLAILSRSVNQGESAISRRMNSIAPRVSDQNSER